jgi:hypothetical protein
MRRTVVRGAVLVACGVFGALATVRCADVNRGLGASCIRDSDCQSGLCAGQQCVAQPPLFDGGNAVDAGEDGSPAEAGDDGSPGHDAGPPMKDATTPPKDTGVDAKTTSDGGDAASHADGAAVDGAAVDGPASDGAHDDAAAGDAHSGDASMKDGAASG